MRQDYSKRKRLAPKPRAGVANVVFSFSDLKYFFECPYQFKLRILYGFNAPIHEALGYGKSLHDALAEVHARAIRDDVAEDKEVPDLRRTAPARSLRVSRTAAAAGEGGRAGAARLPRRQSQGLRQDRVLGEADRDQPGRRRDRRRAHRPGAAHRHRTRPIVDLKSNDRAQAEDVTETQLHVYALGYQDLTGRRADYVEIYELDERKRKPRSVDDDFIADVKAKVRDAAQALRSGKMPTAPAAKKCGACDYRPVHCGDENRSLSDPHRHDAFSRYRDDRF